jgi:hypothetical protein
VTAKRQKAEDRFKTTTIKFDRKLYEKTKQLADTERRDFGSQVNVIIEQWFEQQEKGKEAS